MAVLLTLLQALAPVLLRAATNGTAIEIVEAALKLIGLLQPLLSDPGTIGAAQSLTDTLTTLAARPAEPDDPAMARVAPGHKFGGR